MRIDSMLMCPGCKSDLSKSLNNFIYTNDHSRLMSYCREFYSPWHIESLRNEILTLNLAKINDKIINNVI